MEKDKELIKQINKIIKDNTPKSELCFHGDNEEYCSKCENDNSEKMKKEVEALQREFIKSLQMKDGGLDYRIYLSIISDIKSTWEDGEKMEYSAMDFMARKIFEKFIIIKP